MPSFGTVQLPDTNYLLDAASGKTTADVARTQIFNQGGQLANQLASNTLGSNTRTAANVADAGDIANQFAPQKNALELTQLRQQLGLESSPAYDALQRAIGGQPAGAAPTSANGDFVDQMDQSESSGRPGVVNAGGYAGNFQFGAPRLSELGLYTPAPGEINGKTWNGQMAGTFSIPGFPEVKTKADFLANPQAQRAAMGAQVADIDKAISQTPGADKFDRNGLRAVAHLGGVEGMQQFVATGGQYNPGDNPKAPGGGTRLSDYYGKFSGVNGATALQQAHGHPDGPLTTAAAAPGVTLSPGAPVPAPAPVQTASRGPMPGDTANDGTSAPQGPAPGFGSDGQPLPAGSWDASPVAAAPAAPTGQGLPDVMARLRAGQAAPADAAPQVQNPNALLPLAATDGSSAPAPQNALAPAPVAAPAVAPTATPAQPAAQPGTGMNSPQVQQAQALLHQATQIEMIAAQSPNDPRVKALAAAKVAELRGQAQVLMQADSYAVDPKNGLQTSRLTGEQKSAAVPTLNYHEDPNNPGVMVSPGGKPVVIPPGRATTLPDGSTWITGPGGTFKMVRDSNLEGASAAAAAAAGGKQAAESAAKTKEALVPLARTSAQAIGNIDYGLRQLDEAAKGGIPTGYFAPALATAAAAAKSLGVKIPGVDPAAVSNIQTASKTLAVVSGAILQNIIGKGEITDGKIEAFIHAQPGIVNDPQATHRILNWARSQFTYDHEMAMDGLSNVDPKSGQLSPGWQAGYITKHGAGPIFDSASGEMKQPDGQTPSREPQPAPATPPASPPTPAVGTIMQGHTFLGGDPSSPASWRPVAAPAVAPSARAAPHAELN